ncbi:hypothetical protein [Breoghania sp.]|uniref:hypothetical protein n=1 Tax=Breoghania sp. TaxID=2065378 RepID=UPI00260BDF05|nr:hypothetical protein [Breoghania sp.]MDJ0931930.1 hypothetical protein [Breoghania sp.]
MGDEKLTATPEFQALKTQHDKLVAAWRAGDRWNADIALTAWHHAAPESLEAFYDGFEERLLKLKKSVG